MITDGADVFLPTLKFREMWRNIVVIDLSKVIVEDDLSALDKLLQTEAILHEPSFPYVFLSPNIDTDSRLSLANCASTDKPDAQLLAFVKPTREHTNDVIATSTIQV